MPGNFACFLTFVIFKLTFSEKYLWNNILVPTVWNQTRHFFILLGVIWVQIVCKGYQMMNVATDVERDKLKKKTTRNVFISESYEMLYKKIPVFKVGLQIG